MCAWIKVDRASKLMTLARHFDQVSDILSIGTYTWEVFVLDVWAVMHEVPIKDTLLLLQARFDEKTVDLFRHVLTSTYFLYNGKFYEQVEVGSPLSPAIANFYMEDFEERALRTAPLRPKYFFRYVDDTFIVWPHGPEALTEFLGHMNSVHPNIQLTMETEKNKRLPSLDILIERKRDGSLGHQVYRKPTHTDLYLNKRSHHHPAQKRGIISTLVHRATSVSDQEHLEAEIQHLRKTFQQNEYRKSTWT
ncbi:uncharacterized protein [Hetaerina americana]|uniref:uncharacterized protein n=1 Tax=Hetaerina americana TaxID=62018 RepID=UPI003A7F2D4B